MASEPVPVRGPRPPASVTDQAEAPVAVPQFTKEQVEAVLNALDPFWTRAIGPEGKSLVAE